jgi:DNA processing protein
MTELALAAFAAESDAHVVSRPRSRRFGRFAAAFDEREYRRELERRGLRFLARSDPQFPPLLGAIHDPPPGLFLRGEAEAALLSRPAVAIVGARACSAYGAGVARLLGRELASAGLVVVSGLARGVDGETHRGALEAGAGGSEVTVAVLGCGIDRIYPAAHVRLAGEIAERGLVLSEYAPGVPPAPWRFPARNRIIAGLAAITIVVEAREGSGALITADFALEEGREVLAVPGEITSALAAGSNGLLRLGATPLTRPEDVLELFGLETARREMPVVSPTARAVLERVQEEPREADAIGRLSGLAAGEVAAALAELELAGLVAESAGLYRGVRPAG